MGDDPVRQARAIHARVITLDSHIDFTAADLTFAAMSAAAETGPVVVAADIEAEFQPLTLDQVAAFHVDVDGTGDLAWFATQELDQVLDLLRD